MKDILYVIGLVPVILVFAVTTPFWAVSDMLRFIVGSLDTTITKIEGASWISEYQG